MHMLRLLIKRDFLLSFGSVDLSTGACRGYKGLTALDPELQADVGQLTWVFQLLSREKEKQFALLHHGVLST